MQSKNGNKFKEIISDYQKIHVFVTILYNLEIEGAIHDKIENTNVIHFK